MHYCHLETILSQRGWQSHSYIIRDSWWFASCNANSITLRTMQGFGSDVAEDQVCNVCLWRHVNKWAAGSYGCFTSLTWILIYWLGTPGLWYVCSVDNITDLHGQTFLPYIWSSNPTVLERCSHMEHKNSFFHLWPSQPETIRIAGMQSVVCSMSCNATMH